MLQGFELRFEKALRAEIEEEVATFALNMTGIPQIDPGKFAMDTVREVQNYTTLQNVLDMMDELIEELAKDG
jgi:hypothetical protein